MNRLELSELETCHTYALAICKTLFLCGISLLLLGCGPSKLETKYEDKEFLPHPQMPIEFAYNELIRAHRDHGRSTLERALEFVKAFPERKQYLGESPELDAQIAHDAWCGFFVAWCLREAGYEYPSDPLSLSAWREVSFEVDEPRRGDIAIMKGHVAFYWETQDSDGYPLLVGGNQQLLFAQTPRTLLSIGGQIC